MNVFRWIAAAILVMLPVVSVPAADAGQQGNFTLTTGVTLDAFRADSPQQQEGTQWSSPLSLSYQRGDLALSLSTAYANAAVEQSGAEPSSSNISHLADSLLAGSYIWPEFSFGAATAGFAVNLPTGKASLDASERSSEAGQHHDLFTIDDFGEGLKAGVNLGVARAFGAVTAGASGSYVYTGAFDPTSDEPDDDLDPGDQWLLTTLVNWAASDRIILDSAVTYTYYTPDRVEGSERFQQGANVAISSALRFQATPTLNISVHAQHARHFKSQEYADDRLRVEPENSSGQEASGALSASYQHTERLTLRGQTDVRYRAESERWDRASGFPHEGQRVRYAIGGGVTVQVNEHLALTGGASYFRLNQEQDRKHEQDITYQGVTVNVGVSVIF